MKIFEMKNIFLDFDIDVIECQKNSKFDLTLNLKHNVIRGKNELNSRHKLVNPQAPVAQKIADAVVFRRFKGEGVEFFKSNLTAPPLRFLMRIF